MFPTEFKKENEIIKNKLPKTEEELGYYLAGLIEGDGSISKNKIEIVFHLNDLCLANYLKNRLNIGNIYKIKNELAIKYVISNKDGILKIINLINGKFYSNYKINYMVKHNYENKYKIKILPPLDPNLVPLDTNHFLAGFSDADSCFDITISNSKTHKIKKNVKLNYRIKQKDITIINYI